MTRKMASYGDSNRSSWRWMAIGLFILAPLVVSAEWSVGSPTGMSEFTTFEDIPATGDAPSNLMGKIKVGYFNALGAFQEEAKEWVTPVSDGMEMPMFSWTQTFTCPPPTESTTGGWKASPYGDGATPSPDHAVNIPFYSNSESAVFSDKFPIKP